MPFLPTDIAGSRLWLAADAITGLSDGDPVATWEDASAVGTNDATQATGADQPTYQTAELNSLPIVRFDGTSDYLALPNLMSGLSAGTAVYVAKCNTDPSASTATAGAPLGDWGSAAAANHHPFTDGVIYDDFGSTARKTAGNPTASLASWHIYSVVSAASDWRDYVNGTALHSTGTNTVGWGSSPILGRSFSGTVYSYFPGEIAEVVAYGSALSTADRQSLEGYLAHKWGIASVLPGDHPYKASPPGGSGISIPVVMAHLRNQGIS